MHRLLLPVAALAFAGSLPVPATEPDGWRLVWSDEFEGNRIDETNWIVMRPGGRGNQAHYEPDKVAVRDGVAILTAGDAAGRTTGGQIRTQIMHGPNTGERRTFTPPVRIAVRADYNLTEGSAGSFWFFSRNWVQAVRDTSIYLAKEFDVVELHGAVTARNTGPDKYHHNAHIHRWDRQLGREGRERKHLIARTTPATPGVGDIITGDRWVVFVMEWLTGSSDADKRVRYFIDDQLVYERSVVDWPERDDWRDDIRQIWDEPMSLVLSCDAIGSLQFWGGVEELDPRLFPIDCRFDYVRVYVPR